MALQPSASATSFISKLYLEQMNKTSSVKPGCYLPLFATICHYLPLMECSDRPLIGTSAARRGRSRPNKILIKLFIIRTSQMLWNMYQTIGGHSDWEVQSLLHSCGTAADLHCTFPVSSSGCSPLEPMKYADFTTLIQLVYSNILAIFVKSLILRCSAHKNQGFYKNG